MTSSRSRPRLRLGPVDGHDEDFDPLLGRAARDSTPSLPSLASAPVRAETVAAPDSSVFDEPDQAGPDGELPPQPVPQPEPPPAPPVPTVTWQPISAEIPVRRLPSQPPGKGLFVFRNPWRGAPGPLGGTPPAPTPVLSQEPPEPAPGLPFAPQPDLADSAASDTQLPEPAASPPAGEPALLPELEAAAPADFGTKPAAGSRTDPEPLPDPVATAAPEPTAESATEPTPPSLALEPEPSRWPFGVGQAPPSPPSDVVAVDETPALAAGTGDSETAEAEQALLPLPDQAPAAPEPAVAAMAAPRIEDRATERPARRERPARPRPAPARRGKSGKPVQRRASRSANAEARRAAGLPPLWALFVASFLTGAAALMTGAAFAAPLGGAFQMFSDHLMYLMVLPLVALALWIAARSVIPALLAALVLLVQGVIVVPSLGQGPEGGDTRTTVGWASLAGSKPALDAVLREAERQQARLLLLGDAPESVLVTPPEGWIIAARPTPGDGAAITILSRGGWRAANVAGEPAMARTEDGSLTVIGVNPPPTAGDTRARDAEINRSAARAGVQTTPTLAIGTFGVVPWNGAISQFTSYGNVTRVRCGGLFGATEGLLAMDHAFVRDVTVTGCRTTGALAGSGHRPIWIRLGAAKVNDAAQQDQ